MVIVKKNGKNIGLCRNIEGIEDGGRIVINEEM